MRASRLIAAAVVFLVGLLWIGQGTGLIGGSPMSNVAAFALIGAALLIVAVIIVLRERQVVAHH